MQERPSARQQRLWSRNLIIDYLELASSESLQIEYEARIPIAQVSNEIINQWLGLIPHFDFDWCLEPEFSLEERRSLIDFHKVWASVSTEAPDPMPDTIHALIGTEIWQRLLDEAASTLAIFAVRGRSDDVSLS